jgi:phage protein D
LVQILKGFADSYPHAIYRLLVNGTDIGTIVQDRLIRMQITDNRGIESDSIEIELSDHDGLVEIPPKGQRSKHGLVGAILD